MKTIKINKQVDDYVDDDNYDMFSTFSIFSMTSHFVMYHVPHTQLKLTHSWWVSCQMLLTLRKQAQQTFSSDAISSKVIFIISPKINDRLTRSIHLLATWDASDIQIWFIENTRNDCQRLKRLFSLENMIFVRSDESERHGKIFDINYHVG